MTQGLHVLLTRWKGNGFINELTYKRLLTSDGNIPRAYELIKIHKAGNLLRVIVSSINSLLYDFFLTYTTLSLRAYHKLSTI